MEEYAVFFKLGSVAALVLLAGLALRLMGFRYNALPGMGKSAKGKARGKAKGRRKPKKKAGQEIYFQQDDYVDDGDGDGEWKDGDMYAMKEGKVKSRGMNDGKGNSKKEDEYESWEDY